ncbi:MAG TPA: TylF/MycF/NovP-related O-methyltransferase [Pyrinomonadaceae bacterium]
MDLQQDLTDEERDLLKTVRPFTLTSVEEMLALIDAVSYVEKNQIPGAIVECGVWRGGMMMLAAELLVRLDSTDRKLYLYDAFKGMPPASEEDIRFDGRTTEEVKAIEGVKREWCLASMDEVRSNLISTGYPADKVHIVEGYVEDTLPSDAPDAISILRLDTDWYASTKHELTHLYPRVVPGGVLIVDDYGYWKGSKKAVDEYFAENGSPHPLLQRIDLAGRLVVKSGVPRSSHAPPLEPAEDR